MLANIPRLCYTPRYSFEGLLCVSSSFVKSVLGPMSLSAVVFLAMRMCLLDFRYEVSRLKKGQSTEEMTGASKILVD